LPYRILRGEVSTPNRRSRSEKIVISCLGILAVIIVAGACVLYFRFVPQVNRDAKVAIVRVSDQVLLSEWNDIEQGDWLFGKGVVISVTRRDDTIFLKPLCKPKGGCRLDHEFTATKSETLTNQVLSYSDLANTIYNASSEMSEMGYSSGFTIRVEPAQRSIFLRVWTWDRDEQETFPVKPEIYEGVIH